MAWGNNNGRPSVVECKLDNGFLWYAQQNADGGRYFEVNGPINATAFNQTSDREKKDNIEVISDATVKLRMMNGYTYTLKSNGMPYAGVIAQEVQDAIPEAFSGTFEYID
ncbi:tail fiber domain-containing protein, partial [Aeromonas veronii]|nr:tail fiber domain-containing protein [Aeromonas veronii]